MKRKTLVYLASTAVLVAASTQQIFADESTQAVISEKSSDANHEELTSAASQAILATQDEGQKENTQEESAPKGEDVTATTQTEEKEKDKPAETVGTVEEAKASEETSQVETEVKEEQPADKANSTGRTSFYSAQNNQSTARSNPAASVRTATFVDVSSHNGYISVEDYKELARKGVAGTVVKLTEGTTYKNPYASSQIQNAQAAGFQVSAYAFSHYTSDEEARREARYFAEEAKRLNLPLNTVMVNDMEDPKMKTNINSATQAWAAEMRSMGFTNLMYYTSASWLDNNNLRSKGPVQTAKHGLQNFWVAQYPTPKLSADDAKTLKYNSSAGAWQFTAQAQLLAGKHVFDQSVDYTGRFTDNAPLVKQGLKGDISIKNNNPDTGTFDVVVSNVSNFYGVKEVSVPVWSTHNGQDDLVFYRADKQADGTYKATIRASNHKNSVGEYNVHLYYVQNDGKMVGVGGTKTTVTIGKPKGKITISNQNNSNGSFDIIISEVSNPTSIKTVAVPVWSSANGQDDIVWYTATKQVNGTYKVHVESSAHKHNTGEYNVHLYYVQNDGQLVGVGGTKTQVSIANTAPKGTISITNNNKTNGSFDVIISNVSSPKGVKTVSVPVWSSANGQDDLIFYTAEKQSNGTYKVHVDASKHKNSTGDYNVHLYYVQDDGQMVNVGGTKTQVSIANTAPKGTISIANNNKPNGSFDVIISNVSSPKGVKIVSVPVWSSANGQDDLIFYTAEKQANGTYKVHVDASKHKNSTGDYNVHLYYVQDDGQMVNVGGTKTQVSIAAQATTLQGKISIQNNNADQGTFDVIISDVSSPKGVKTVSVPVWSSANGQDDLIFYTAEKQANGTYKVHVKSSAHKYSAGEYNIHLYYVQNDGQMVGVGGTKTQVSIGKPQGKITISNHNNKVGSFDVIISEAYNPKGLKTVSVPIWSSDKGQDDIVWYTAEKQSNGTYKVHVEASDHRYSTGDYNVHLYYVGHDNQLVGAGGTKTKMTRTEPIPKTSFRIQNVDQKAGTYKVVVNQVDGPKTVKGIKVAAWSDSKQSNLFWYDVKPTGNRTEIDINSANHHFASGDYITHVYLSYTDNTEESFNAGTARLTPQVQGQKARVLNAAAALVGVKGGSAEHHRLVSDYNSVRPLPVGYAVKNSDDWCDIFVTVMFQRQGLSHLIGRECGVERHIQIFKSLGIWNENGNATPQAGDIITFNWDQSHQQNDGWADHIGIVEKVENGVIHTIEGNSNNQVKRNTYRIGHGNIRGFATPRYA